MAPHYPTLVRLSSMPAGSSVRPPVYTIVEDIVAVNGGGGKAYRRAIDQRYQRSPVFQRLLSEMSWAWGLWTSALGIVLIILIAVGSRPGYETLRQVLRKCPVGSEEVARRERDLVF
ncbi:MAG: hypothetical protein LQ340_005769 [Diploschistes diacapsis]|nr:MAG: hypothetical protein LQ340_005769 [Diploschistes diacapsis]